MKTGMAVRQTGIAETFGIDLGRGLQILRNSTDTYIHPLTQPEPHTSTNSKAARPCTNYASG